MNCAISSLMISKLIFRILEIFSCMWGAMLVYILVNLSSYVCINNWRTHFSVEQCHLACKAPHVMADMEPTLVASLLTYWEFFLVIEFRMPILMPSAFCHVLVPCLVQGKFDGRPIVYFWIDIGVNVVYQTPLRRYYQKNTMTPAKFINCQLHTIVVRVAHLSISRVHAYFWL